MERTQGSYPPILEEISLLQPESLTLGAIMNYRTSTTHLLSLLILIHKIEQSSNGRPLEGIVNSIGAAFDSFQNEAYEQRISAVPSPLLLTALAEKIKDIDIDSVEMISASVAKGVVKMINSAGFGVEAVMDTLFYLLNLSENAWCGIGRNLLSAKRLLELGAPLLNKTHPTIFELYDLIEEYRKGSVVHCDTNHPDYDTYLIALDKWLSHNPPINTYIS
eukprot:TRINITY_DN19901_c0_g1_i1.p1 TRINITY_DN19901_c0_g1~~TRINITY_DN19901_c0_g1_i1.p1  ORF type:complete len:220 (+),score=46.51 TRINITY_DN19901_c0_g1_i1:60-719(+)